MRRIAGTVLMGLMLAVAPARAQPVEDARAIADAEAAAWNAHDAHAFAALFAPDGTFVNGVGLVRQGRDEIEARLGQGFATIFAGTGMRIDAVSVRPLGADAASALVRWSLAGLPANAGGPAERRIVQSLALERVDGRWRIAALHDGASVEGADAAIAAATAPPAAPPAKPAPPPRRCILARANGDCLIKGKPL